MAPGASAAIPGSMGCAAPNPLHWQDLRQRPAETIGLVPGVTRTSDGFEVAFLDARYLVDPQGERIEELGPEPGRCPGEAFQILLIRYLVSSGAGEPADELVSEKELPGGATFFQGPHALLVEPVIQRFGADPPGFVACGLALGGECVELGDAAVRFWPFPKIPVTYVLWQADDEFPASVSVLFDRSISRWFELDMVFLLVAEVTGRIVGG